MTVLEREDREDVGRIDGGIDGAVELGEGWAVRLARGSRGRLALEVYAGSSLLDVMVEGALTAELLRGARRTAPDTAALAWGLLPPDGRAPQVRFGRAGRAAADETALRIVAGRFWIALGEATSDRVAVTARSGAPWQELRVSTLRRPRST